MTASAVSPGPPVLPLWSFWTVILLKPDCVARGLTGPVLAMAGETVRITCTRPMIPAAEQILEHYAGLLPRSAELGVDVKGELVRTYVGHPVMVALGYSPDAVPRMRAALGHRDPAVAGAETIRGRFGTDSLATARSEGRLISNLIHSSEHADDVPRDLARWFGPGSTVLLRPPTTQGEPR